MLTLLKRIVTSILDWFLYTALSEKQKKTLSNLFSDRQKTLLKRLTRYGKKHSQKLKVKQLKDHLYSLGFRDLALQELIQLTKTEKDSYLKRLAAWELTLWYANQYTKDGAEQALFYVGQARNGEKDSDQLRRIAIIQAECLDRMGRQDEARQLLTTQMSEEEHPDLFLARANLEENIEHRLTWINKVYHHFNVHPITFTSFDEPTYDSLKMKQTTKKTYQQPKVSIIMPCYNAETGVQIAIESILSQTWENIELIIVDDQSTDQTLQVIQSYAEQDDRIKVCSTPQNSGPYIARNIALQQATGEFITVNDADDWSHEKKVETQAKHLLQNPSIIANTSAHARLTEDLYLYRRGTPGRYIFPNMSSIMFRREPVMDQLGYWDSVRFAADGEFKRRLIKVFGEECFVDLSSAPLSLPRQSVSSLTSSSAFGYNGFFMGVRKEYVESLEYFHKHHNDLYYSYPQTMRPFPVPEPMWPNREGKTDGKRDFDIVIASDFRKASNENALAVQEIVKQKSRDNNEPVGLVQMYDYDLSLPLDVSPYVRKHIDGEDIQMLVYGEKINIETLVMIDYNVIRYEQTYIPEMLPKHVHIIITDPNIPSLAQMEKDIMKGFGTEPYVQFFPLNTNVRADIEETLTDRDLSRISQKDWVMPHE